MPEEHTQPRHDDQPDVPGDILDVRGAAAHLKINDQTLRRLAREGGVPAFRVGTAWRFKRSWFDRWAESQLPRRKRNHILLIDDEEVVLDVLRRMLESEDIDVTVTRNGSEAVKLLEHTTVDLVILDLKMPGMDGPTTLGHIRQRCSTMPVIILTAYPDGELMSRAMRHSPFTLLAKPVTRRQFLQTIWETLKGSSGTAHVTGTPAWEGRFETPCRTRRVDGLSDVREEQHTHVTHASR